jgi:hypothetical protein
MNNSTIQDFLEYYKDKLQNVSKSSSFNMNVNSNNIVKKNILDPIVEQLYKITDTNKINDLLTKLFSFCDNYKKLLDNPNFDPIFNVILSHGSQTGDIKLVPDNCLICITTPPNRFLINNNTKDSKLISMISTNNAFLEQYIKNPLCTQLYKDLNNVNIKNKFFMSTVYFPGQPYYDINITPETDNSINLYKYQGLYTFTKSNMTIPKPKKINYIDKSIKHINGRRAFGTIQEYSLNLSEYLDSLDKANFHIIILESCRSMDTNLVSSNIQNTEKIYKFENFIYYLNLWKYFNGNLEHIKQCTKKTLYNKPLNTLKAKHIKNIKLKNNKMNEIMKTHKKMNKILSHQNLKKLYPTSISEYRIFKNLYIPDTIIQLLDKISYGFIDCKDKSKIKNMYIEINNIIRKGDIFNEELFEDLFNIAISYPILINYLQRYNYILSALVSFFIYASISTDESFYSINKDNKENYYLTTKKIYNKIVLPKHLVLNNCNLTDTELKHFFMWYRYDSKVIIPQYDVIIYLQCNNLYFDYTKEKLLYSDSLSAHYNIFYISTESKIKLTKLENTTNHYRITYKLDLSTFSEDIKDIKENLHNIHKNFSQTTGLKDALIDLTKKIHY